MTSSQNAVGQRFLNQTLAAMVDPTPYVRKDFGTLINLTGGGLANVGEFIKNLTKEEEKQEKQENSSDTESEDKPAESEPPAAQETKLPGRPDRYTGDGQTGQDTTTVPGTLRDINQAYIDLQRQIYGDLPGLITQAGEENRRTIEATSAAAKEREVIAQWGATQRAMVQRDAAMALGLMNTAYLANTPNVSLMQQLNAPLAAVASNYKLQMPGGSK
tara:strand:+ start:632 stop:1282 length:651 start_codon:yes stop_codon:yes gene_type:complete